MTNDWKTCVREVSPDTVSLIREIFPSAAPLIRDDAHLIDDLGLDSLDRVQLAEELEKRLGFIIPEAVLQNGCRLCELQSGPPYTPAKRVAALPAILSTPQVLSYKEKFLSGLRGLCFLGLTIPAAITLFLPLPAVRRRAITRRLAQVFLRCAKIRTVVYGALPAQGSSVLIANHQSYIDAIVLHALLPAEVTFVAKGEFRASVMMRRILTGLGIQLLERWKVKEAVRDLGVIRRTAASQHVVFFPEGTFDGQSTLLPFKRGAFVVAAMAGVPIVPIAIKGTRTVLPPGSWLMRRGSITIRVFPPIQCSGGLWKVARGLCERTHEQLSRELCQ